MKKICKKDITMWLAICIIILCIALIRNHIELKNDKELVEKINIKNEIEASIMDVTKKDPNFYIPNYDYIYYRDNGQVAEEIEIKNYEMSKGFRKVKYILKNNYDFNIFITPELTDEVEDTDRFSMQLIYYDFNTAYMILKPGEEVELQITITQIEREKVNKKDFKAHRVIYMDNENRTVVGYIEIGGVYE